MPRVGEQARELLQRRRLVEQRAQPGRERGHHSILVGSGTATRTTSPSQGAPSREQRPAPLPSPAWTVHPTALAWAATSPRWPSSRSTPASASCGSIRSARVVAAPACCATRTPTACHLRGAGTCSTGAASSRGCGSVATSAPTLDPRRAAHPGGASTPRARGRCPLQGLCSPSDRARRATGTGRTRTGTASPRPEPARTTAPARTSWSPHDRPGPEFEHVLDARTPLLARAFEGSRPVDDE